MHAYTGPKGCTLRVLWWIGWGGFRVFACQPQTALGRRWQTKRKIRRRGRESRNDTRHSGKQAAFCLSKQTHTCRRGVTYTVVPVKTVSRSCFDSQTTISGLSHTGGGAGASGYQCYRLQLETLFRYNYPISGNCGPRREGDDG